MPYKPRGLYFEQFQVGEVFVCQGRTVTEADTVLFAALSGDYNLIHTDEEYSKAHSPFGSRIAHGMLVLAMATGQSMQLGIFEGTNIALIEQTVKYVGPVRFGDTVHLEFRVAAKRETSKPDRGIITLDTTVLNQHDKPVIEGQWVVMMKRAQP